MAATGFLVSSPGTYAWVRRRVGLEHDEQYELDRPDAQTDETPVDLREARLSLRARLAEHHELAADETADEPAPAADAEPLREAAREARERLRRSARAASSRFADAG